MSLPSPKQASRVLRTIHQAIVAAIVAFGPFVAVLDLPAEKVAYVSAITVALVGAVARLYNHLFPAEEPLAELP